MRDLDLDLCLLRKMYDELIDLEVPEKASSDYDLLKSVKFSCKSVIHQLKYLKKLEREVD